MTDTPAATKKTNVEPVKKEAHKKDPVEVSDEELAAIIAQKNQRKAEAFEGEYRLICQKYKMELIPQVIIINGQIQSSLVVGNIN